MNKPSYPGRDTAPSYCGPHVPAECLECPKRMYVAPKSFSGGEGYCPGCDSVVAWDYWREELA